MQRGFTLIEIVLVIFITSLLATVVMPSAMGVQRMIYDIELEGAADMLAGDLRLLQQLSLNAGFSHYYALAFNVYQKPQMYYITDRINIAKKALLKDVFVVYAPERDIVFSSNGAPNQGYTIILQHIKTGRTKEVTVLPATGRVMVK